MNPQQGKAMQDVLVLSAELPLRWQILESLPSPSEITAINKNNEKFLEVILSSDEIFIDADQQSNKEIWHELKKLDAKMNMLMEWVGGLILQQQGIQKRHPIELSARGVDFSCEGGFNSGDLVSLEVFLEENYPQALNLIGRVMSSENTPQSNQVRIEFIEINSHVQGLLEKYIFRIHRRSIAQSRKSSADISIEDN